MTIRSQASNLSSQKYKMILLKFALFFIREIVGQLPEDLGDTLAGQGASGLI